MSQKSIEFQSESTVKSASGWVTTAPSWLVGYAIEASTVANEVRFRNSIGGSIRWRHGMASATNTKGGTNVAALPFTPYFGSGIYASMSNVPMLSVAYIVDVKNRG